MKLGMGRLGLSLLAAPSVVALGLDGRGFKTAIVPPLTHSGQVACLASVRILIAGTIDMLRRVKTPRQYRQGVHYDHD